MPASFCSLRFKDLGGYPGEKLEGIFFPDTHLMLGERFSGFPVGLWFRPDARPPFRTCSDEADIDDIVIDDGSGLFPDSGVQRVRRWQRRWLLAQALVLSPLVGATVRLHWSNQASESTPVNFFFLQTLFFWVISDPPKCVSMNNWC